MAHTFLENLCTPGAVPYKHDTTPPFQTHIHRVNASHKHTKLKKMQRCITDSVMELHKRPINKTSKQSGHQT